MRFIRLVTWIALLVLIHTSGSAQQRATTASNRDQFTIEDSLGLRTISESPALSPDGRYVVYLIVYVNADSSHDGNHQQMWLADTKTKQNTLMTDQAWDWSKATWSPDGKRVAFYDKVGSGTGIRVWSLETKHTKLVASDVELYDLLPWSPDGKFIYARRVSRSAGQTSTEEAKTEDSKNGITVYRSEEVKDKPPVYFSSPDVESTILAFEVDTGAEMTILRRNKMDYFTVSPNGKFMAWCENQRAFARPEFYSLADIGIVDLSTRAAQIVAHDFRDLHDFFGNSLSWSTDGNTLAFASLPLRARGHSAVYAAVDASSRAVRPVFTSAHPQDNRSSGILLWVNAKQFIVKEGANGHELWLVSIDGRKPYRIYESSSGSIQGIILGANRWDVWHPKPDTLALFIRRDDNMKLVPVLVNYAAPSSSELPAQAQYPWPSEWRPRGIDLTGVAVVEFQDSTHPQDIYLMSADGSFDQLTHINPQIANKEFGTIRLLEWQENGKPKRAVLLLPANYVPGKRYPTIVSQYPGFLWSRQMFKFGLDSTDEINQQIFASRGYAVLVPDICVPALPKNVGEWGCAYPSERPNMPQAIASQINTAVDYAVKQGYVDPDRLGITGSSFGGYGVMSAIISTPRFKAAIAQVALVDVMSESWQFTNGTAFRGFGYADDLGATLWKDRELYIANSPFYFLDRVRTPLLLTRGTKDEVVTTQPEQAYIGMKVLGKDVTLVEYEGDGHGLDSSYAHRKDDLERVIQFFDEHLKTQSPNSESSTKFTKLQ